MSDEFSIINTYFAPLSPLLGDDCGLLELDPGLRLATSVDTMVENVHFYADSPPCHIGYRGVVTALSDLAAMGATALAFSLALTMPAADDTWLRQFTQGIQDAMREYQVALIGGDTTRGPLTLSVQVFGSLPLDQALTRAGARAGDQVYVSGCTGDAAAALTVMNGHWAGGRQHREYLLRRFYRPQVQLQLGQQLLSIASSAIDISDGLLADAAHLCEQSEVGMTIRGQDVPLSPALQSLADAGQARQWALTGGDDYQLLFTVPPAAVTNIPAGCSCIGEVTAGDSVSCDVATDNQGYQHFA